MAGLLLETQTYVSICKNERCAPNKAKQLAQLHNELHAAELYNVCSGVVYVFCFIGRAAMECFKCGWHRTHLVVKDNREIMVWAMYRRLECEIINGIAGIVYRRMKEFVEVFTRSGQGRISHHFEKCVSDGGRRTEIVCFNETTWKNQITHYCSTNDRITKHCDCKYLYDYVKKIFEYEMHG